MVSYPRVQSFIREGRRRKAVLGVDEETFRAVLDWIYAGIFPKPESTGTQTTHDARTHWRMARARHASSRSTHRLDMRAYIRLYNAAVKLGVDSLAAVAKAFLQGQSTRSPARLHSWQQ